MPERLASCLQYHSIPLLPDMPAQRRIVYRVVENQIDHLRHGNFFDGGGEASLVGQGEAAAEQRDVHVRGRGVRSSGPGAEQNGPLHLVVDGDGGGDRRAMLVLESARHRRRLSFRVT